MISTGAVRRAIFALLLALSSARSALPQPPTPAPVPGLPPASSPPASTAASPATAADPTLLRVFLKDGSMLVSYGEFSRVGDHVVISLPIQMDPLKLQVVSIPEDRVNWEKTDAYADSARATRYAAVRGPADFAALNASVSQALNDIGLQQDPQRKLAMATEARQNLTKWLADHFGYRASDVAQMASWFDDIIAKTRTAAGQPNFELSLIAANAAAPSTPLLPTPDDTSMLEQGYQAALMADSAAERTSLLRAIREALQGRSDASLVPLRTSVATRLADEERTTSSYSTYIGQVLRAAARLAAKADVQGLIDMAAHILDDDDRMGHKRPEQIASLLTAVDAKLEAARELRLARDQWEARQQERYAYYHSIALPERALRLSRPALSAIQQLAGPPPDALGRAKVRLTMAAQALNAVKPPPQMETAHSLLTGAMQLATRAVENRFRAVQGGSMQQARDAASAAGGALLLFDRATQELQRAEAPPQLK
jgi:hypothetical protein